LNIGQKMQDLSSMLKVEYPVSNVRGNKKVDSLEYIFWVG
jgi:hypothetical protein